MLKVDACPNYEAVFVERAWYINREIQAIYKNDVELTRSSFISVLAESKINFYLWFAIYGKILSFLKIVKIRNSNVITKPKAISNSPILNLKIKIPTNGLLKIAKTKNMKKIKLTIYLLFNFMLYW